MSIMFGIVGVGVFSAIIYCFYGSKLINYRLKEIWIDLRLTLLASIVSSLIVFLIGIMFSQYNHLFVFIVQICVFSCYCTIYPILKTKRLVITFTLDYKHLILSFIYRHEKTIKRKCNASCGMYYNYNMYRLYLSQTKRY